MRGSFWRRSPPPPRIHSLPAPTPQAHSTPNTARSTSLETQPIRSTAHATPHYPLLFHPFFYCFPLAQLSVASLPTPKLATDEANHSPVVWEHFPDVCRLCFDKSIEAALISSAMFWWQHLRQERRRVNCGTVGNCVVWVSEFFLQNLNINFLYFLQLAETRELELEPFLQPYSAPLDAAIEDIATHDSEDEVCPLSSLSTYTLNSSYMFGWHDNYLGFLSCVIKCNVKW